ncbi:MAG: dTDP-4-dehydrorhamnose 3,5-epimerase [Bacteroidetes bacterium]|nr:dTDP-4-dehydrorhamnose 3,5-epimerase [Bacteroidota bacterium]
MQVINTEIPDVKIIKPRVFEDSRGYFFESFRQDRLLEAGITAPFIQDNQSLSSKGIVRGLHFQRPPYAQGKLVRVIKGGVLDVAVDLRRGSSYYGRHIIVELNEQNKWLCWIPEGFAHGFLTLADNTIFSYKCTNYYEKSSEGCIRWNDPDLGIPWDIGNPVLSEKDQQGSPFKNFITPF